MAADAILPKDLQWQDQHVVLVGDAYHKNSDQLLYRELHQLSDDKTKHRVRYLSPEGSLWVDKRISYERNPLTPEFVQTNHLYNLEWFIRWQDDHWVVGQNDASPAVIETSDQWPAVVDSGFDAFVRSRWDQLLAGERFPFEFIFGEKGKALGLQVYQRDCGAEKSELICFQLEPLSWVVKWLAPEILLTYDKQKRLMRYQGLSNIKTKPKGGELVDIRYRYVEEPSGEKAIISRRL